MQTLRDISPYLAVAAVAAALALAVVAAALWRSVRRLRRGQTIVLGEHGEQDLVAHAETLAAQVHGLSTAVEALGQRLDGYKAELDGAFTYRAVVRYDAFRESGGEQSASVAFLDRHRSGIVLSTIHSRDAARVYVKQLRQGVPDRALAPEEVEVIELALAGSHSSPDAPGSEVDTKVDER